MKKFYAEKAIIGRDRTTIISFDSKKDRDTFVAKTNYTNTVSASEAKKKGSISYAEYKYFPVYRGF